jgi:flagellar protein FliO/FliZ
MNASPEMVSSVLKMIAALAIVLGGMFVMLHFARRYLGRAGGVNAQRLVRVVASQAIGVKKSVTLVDVPGAVLVLGVSADRIQLLLRIEDPEALARVRAYDGAAGASLPGQLARRVLRRKADGHED